MKNKLLILFFCILIFGCKKNPFDYRNKFIGDYNYTVHANLSNCPVIGHFLDTTYSYNGKVLLGTQDNTIIIYLSENCSIEPTIYEDGSLEHLSLDYDIHGEFESKTSLKFHYGVGGLGGHAYYDYSGTKQ